MEFSCLQAFLGDDTWLQLFPSQFHEAKPYSSFNVMDLHTVDDGVWQVRSDNLPVASAVNNQHVHNVW